MATAIHKDKKKSYEEPIHYRPSKENAKKILQAVENKMKAENRSRNNCMEEILLDYFKLKKQNSEPKDKRSVATKAK